MRRNALLIVIGIVGLSSLLLALWGTHKSRHAGMGKTATPLLSERQASTERPPTRTLPSSENDEAGVPAGKPPLAVASSDAKGVRPDSDPQFLVVRQMLRDYRAALGENPVGTNAEITKALLGGNSRNARFIASEARLNSAHQLVDRWNHPYFFHQLSRKQMEIRSAGPDGTMWTSDDQISR